MLRTRRMRTKRGGMWPFSSTNNTSNPGEKKSWLSMFTGNASTSDNTSVSTQPSEVLAPPTGPPTGGRRKSRRKSRRR